MLGGLAERQTRQETHNETRHTIHCCLGGQAQCLAAYNAADPPINVSAAPIWAGSGAENPGYTIQRTSIPRTQAAYAAEPESSRAYLFPR